MFNRWWNLGANWWLTAFKWAPYGQLCLSDFTDLHALFYVVGLWGICSVQKALKTTDLQCIDKNKNTLHLHFSKCLHRCKWWRNIRILLLTQKRQNTEKEKAFAMTTMSPHQLIIVPARNHIKPTTDVLMQYVHSSSYLSWPRLSYYPFVLHKPKLFKNELTSFISGQETTNSQFCSCTLLLWYHGFTRWLAWIIRVCGAC